MWQVSHFREGGPIVFLCVCISVHLRSLPEVYFVKIVSKTLWQCTRTYPATLKLLSPLSYSKLLELDQLVFTTLMTNDDKEMPFKRKQYWDKHLNLEHDQLFVIDAKSIKIYLIKKNFLEFNHSSKAELTSVMDPRNRSF